LATSMIPDIEFRAGRLKDHWSFWQSITNDSRILEMVSGCKIELDDEPVQDFAPIPYHFPAEKKQKIGVEIEKMLEKNIIEKTSISEDSFISNIFSRPKKDGGLRVILDLTELNKDVTYRKFKMDSLQTAIDLMTPHCFMASIDWKDAYYSVPVARSMRKYLTFEWEGEFYQYTCLPNGLACAPRFFTRITKVLFSELRKMGHVSTSYIDDCLLLAKNYRDCKANVEATVEMSVNAGFMVHPEKSIFEPTQKIMYLGFWLDSKNMTVTLTLEKAQKIKDGVQKLMNKDTVSIQALAKVVGCLVASIPGVQFGKLFYRSLDNHKTKALKNSRGDFNALTRLPEVCLEDLSWWADNIEHSHRKIILDRPSLTIETDASDSGWGACIKGTNSSTGGHWSEQEETEHINYKELLAVWFGILCFASSKTFSHIKILSDNTTTVAYINNMGGTKEKCNELARKILKWCYHNNNWISAAHLPGKMNVRADKESRSIHDNMEWSLNPEVFQIICEHLGTPEIDLFASRLNRKVESYMSWRPDPEAVAVDAMSENWEGLFFYAFPPFNMIGRVLAKVEFDRCTGILVVPRWHTQPWWPKFIKMCTKPPIALSSPDNSPLLTHRWRMESELPRMQLMAGLISA
jgi:hypothetical protein